MLVPTLAVAIACAFQASASAGSAPAAPSAAPAAVPAPRLAGATPRPAATPLAAIPSAAAPPAAATPLAATPPAAVTPSGAALSGAAPPATAPERVVKIAVMAPRGKDKVLKAWATVSAYLQERVPNTRFEIIAVDIPDMEPLVKAKAVDFAYTNPVSYVALEYRYGATRMLTARPTGPGGKAYSQFGAVIFARKGAGIATLADLRGHSFVAIEKDSFGGFMMAAVELAAAGVDERDFTKLDCLGFPQQKTVEAVLKGQYDAGTVRTDILESMIADGTLRLDDIVVLAPKHFDGFDLIVSTRLYPEWAFVALAHTDQDISRQVASALLAMSASHPAAKAIKLTGFTVPLDYSPVHEILKNLRKAPYEHFGEISTAQMIEQYWPVILGVVVFLFAMVAVTIYVLRLGKTIAKRNADMRQVLENVAQGFFSIDLDGRMSTERSAIVGRWLGDIPVGATLGQILAPVAPATAASLKLGLDAIKEDVLPIELTLGQLPTRLEIGARSISIDYMPIRTGDKTTQLLVVMSDITTELERERLELEHRQAQKLESIGRLASGMAHEINTPIQFVGDQTQFAQTAVGDLLGLVTRYQALIAKVEAGTVTGADVVAIRSAEAESDLGYVHQALPLAFEAALEGVRRVSQLVQALKEFGHPDRGTKQAADINAALRSTVLVAANEVKYVADTVLELDELPAVVCNISELKQVFLNLIVNAGHAIGDLHAEARGRVGITTRVVGNDVVISIADTGCGIPESARAHIFEPFFTTKTVGRGTGQGLAISRLLVDKHAGSLTFESEVGYGTTFHVRIPREPPAAVDAAACLAHHNTPDRPQFRTGG